MFTFDGVRTLHSTGLSLCNVYFHSFKTENLRVEVRAVGIENKNRGQGFSSEALDPFHSEFRNRQS